jgi:hypothetical protein
MPVKRKAVPVDGDAPKITKKVTEILTDAMTEVTADIKMDAAMTDGHVDFNKLEALYDQGKL